MNDRIISFNPCNGVKNLKNEKPKAADTNHRALSVEETTLFLSNAADSWYYLLFKFLLNTGLRIGEALALTWFDVKAEKKEIIVNKTVSRTSNKGFELSNTPKTSSSIRTIPITDTLEAILKDQRQNCQFLFARSILIFPNAKGELSNYNSVNACIKHIIKNIPDGMNDFSVHAFRDTFATRCIEQGMDPHTLMAILGHSSLKMTMDLYAHVMPNTKAEELSKIRIAL